MKIDLLNLKDVCVDYWDAKLVETMPALVAEASLTLLRMKTNCTIWGCGSPVIKVSDHDRHVMSSSPVPLKTRRVGERCTLNRSRAQTSSHWCGVVVRREGASSVEPVGERLAHRVENCRLVDAPCFWPGGSFRSVPLEMVGSSGHEKVPTRRKPDVERPGRPRGERIEGSTFLNGVPGAIFQQDNARPHTTRVAQDFLRHFKTFSWPTRSLDLSPVEHVWDQLKWQMSLYHSVHDLELAVQDLWAHLPQDNIRCLINSMPDRVAACIAAGGGPMRY
ncbi:transposable element Tcb2 transposase [Trichonephila clavipes]|nr:transposable element Tcb2 transposase [Trichonephila clavipes]